LLLVPATPIIGTPRRECNEADAAGCDPDSQAGAPHRPVWSGRC